MTLHGAQVTDIQSNEIKNSPSIVLNHTVGEPISEVSNNRFRSSGKPEVTELNNDTLWQRIHAKLNQSCLCRRPSCSEALGRFYLYRRYRPFDNLSFLKPSTTSTFIHNFPAPIFHSRRAILKCVLLSHHAGFWKLSTNGVLRRQFTLTYLH